MSENRKSISYPQKLILYINCGGKCCHPDCSNHLTQNSTLIGEAAHICGERPTAKRYDPNLTEEQRNSASNLIALCPTCHILVDKGEESDYPKELLLEWKKKAEAEAQKSKNASRINSDLLNLQIEYLETLLDREQALDVLKILEAIKLSFTFARDDSLELDFEIIQARALSLLERTGESQDIYDSLSKRFPEDPRAFLYLAGQALNNGDFDRNNELLVHVEVIAPEDSLLQAQKLVRSCRLEESLSTEDVDESLFPTEKRSKANLYRLYSILLQKNAPQKSVEFIEKAEHLNPDRLENKMARISFDQDEIIEDLQQDLVPVEKIEKLLAYMSEIEADFGISKENNPRKKLNLTAFRFNLENAKHNNNPPNSVYESTGTTVFDLIPRCNLDRSMQEALASFLKILCPPEDTFNQLINHIVASKPKLLKELSQVLFFQFISRDRLFSDAKSFYKELECETFVSLIEALEKPDVEASVKILEEDMLFGAVVANLLPSEFGEISRIVIEKTSEFPEIETNKLLLRDHCKKGEFELALPHLRTINLEQVRFQEELLFFAEVANKNEAWDIEIACLKGAISIGTNETKTKNAELMLFSALLKADNNKEAAELGEKILDTPDLVDSLDRHNKEAVLGQTLQSLAERGEVSKALDLIQKFGHIVSSENIKLLESSLHVRNADGAKALDSLIESVDIAVTHTPEDYARLFMPFTQIEGLLKDEAPNLNSLDVVDQETFLKIKDQDRFYYLGNGNVLDATKIQPYEEQSFLGKELGDKVEREVGAFTSEKSEEVIELIFSREQYILWQSRESFMKLCKEPSWPHGFLVEVPMDGDSIDTTYLVKALQSQSGSSDFFQSYCTTPVPLAFLAMSEGGLTSAVGRISQEQKGFVKCSHNTVQAIQEQEENSSKILEGSPVYLDATSALFLAERNLTRVLDHIADLRVPQSVIKYLFSVRDRFESSPNQAGHMSYSDDSGIRLNEIDPSKYEKVKDNFNNFISYLENKAKVETISPVNKAEAFTEKEVPPELCDATILAKNNGACVITEDFLYVRANAVETESEAPKFASIIFIVRALCEEKKVSFQEYLEFFSYLCGYRLFFLQLKVDDLSKAVFGNGAVDVFTPENIKHLHLDLTLSENYGVNLETALGFVCQFMRGIVLDDSLTVEMCGRIFAEIIPPLLRSRDRELVSAILKKHFDLVLEKNRKKDIDVSFLAEEKIKLLKHQLDIYSTEIDPLYDRNGIFLANNSIQDLYNKN